jgi:hypothetical protein
LAYWIDYGFSFVDSAAAWRTPIAIQLVFAVIVIFVIWGCPESPRWLAKRGRWEEAEEVLCAVHDLKPDDPYIADEMMAIRANIEMETGEGKKNWYDLFKKDHLQTRRRVILAYFALFMNQISGVRCKSRTHALSLTLLTCALDQSRCVLLVFSQPCPL